MKSDASSPLFSSTKLASVVKKHAPASVPPAPTDPLETLVHSYLLWEASSQHASSAMRRIADEAVDFNELRVCLPEEIIGILGPRYPLVEERAMRLRRALNDIYRREHRVGLEHLSSAGKREQRNYLENLDGMLPFVAARILLLHYGHATVPVDDQLIDVLRDAKVLNKSEVAANDAAAAMTKGAGSFDEALRVHHALVRFVDAVWHADSKSLTKAKQLRLAAQRAAEAKAAKVRAEQAKLEAARAEAARLAEERAAAEAKRAAKAEARQKASAERAAARAAQRMIEAKPSRKGAVPAKGKVVAARPHARVAKIARSTKVAKVGKSAKGSRSAAKKAKGRR